MLNMFSFKYYLFSFLLLLQCVVAYSFGLFDNTYSLQLLFLDVSHPLNLFLMHDQTLISLVIYVIIIPMLIPLLLTHLMSTFITPLLKESFRVVFNILLIMVNMSLFATCFIPVLRLCSAIKAYNPFLNNIFNNLVCDNAIIKVIKIMNENDINSALNLCLKTFPNVNMAFVKDMTMKQQIMDLLQAQKLDQANLLLDFCKELPPVIKPSWWFTFSTGITNNLHTVASWSYDNLGTVVFGVVTVCLLFKVKEAFTDSNSDIKNKDAVDLETVNDVLKNQKEEVSKALAEVSGAVVQTNAKLNMLAQELANNENLTASVLRPMTVKLDLLNPLLNSAMTKEVVVALIFDELGPLEARLDRLGHRFSEMCKDVAEDMCNLAQSLKQMDNTVALKDGDALDKIRVLSELFMKLYCEVQFFGNEGKEAYAELNKNKASKDDLEGLVRMLKDYVYYNTEPKL